MNFQSLSTADHKAFKFNRWFHDSTQSGRHTMIIMIVLHAFNGYF